MIDMLYLESIPERSITQTLSIFNIKDEIQIDYEIFDKKYNFVISIEAANFLLEISLDDDYNYLEIVTSERRRERVYLATNRLTLRPHQIDMDRQTQVTDIALPLFKNHYAVPYITLTSKDSSIKKLGIKINSPPYTITP